MAILIWTVGGSLGLFLAGSGLADGNAALVLSAAVVLAATFAWGRHEQRRRDARLGKRSPRGRFYSTI